MTPNPRPAEFTTAQLSRICHVSLRTLQWWDQQGLLHPRIDGHRRRFSASDVRLAFAIRDLRAKGVSLPCIQRLLKRLSKYEAGYLLITGEWVPSREGQKWRVSRPRYCPDEQSVVDFAASLAGPVLLIEIGAKPSNLQEQP